MLYVCTVQSAFHTLTQQFGEVGINPILQMGRRTSEGFTFFPKLQNPLVIKGILSRLV